jgi:hypothetical protein
LARITFDAGSLAPQKVGRGFFVVVVMATGRGAMNVHLELVRQGENVLEMLRHDGWSLEFEGGSYAVVSHRDVPDEPAARRRLTRLGVLTSRSVRIEFDPTPW